MHHNPVILRIKDLISSGSFQESLTLFRHHHLSNYSFITQIPPSLFPSLLKACSSSPSSFSFALQLHSLLLKTNLVSHPITLNSLISTYSKHSDMNAARQLFDTMPHKDPISWSSMINCYAQNGYLYDSIQTFLEMCVVGLDPKPELIAVVVSACGRIGNLSLGRAIHARCVVRMMLEKHCVILLTSLIDMYSRCGDVRSGLKVFDSMGERNVVSWTAMINGCVIGGRCDLAIKLLRRMGVEGVEPNRATLVAVLPASAEFGGLKLGKELHGLVFRRGLELESPVVSGLINMYSKCAGGVRMALIVFERAEERDTVTWSSIMAASSKIGNGNNTFELFRRMKRDGVEPISVTMLALLHACIGLESLDHGQALLAHSLKSGFLSDVNVGNSLIHMFAKCGCIESSYGVFFNLMPSKDSVSYSSMIQSYGLHGRGNEALKLFEEMQELGFKCDGITLLAILSACNHSGVVDEGMKIFNWMRRDHGVDISLEHYACYIDLLGRGGRIEEAWEVVKKMPMKPSLRILSSLISSCRAHGRFEMAAELAHKLIDSEPENAANYASMSMVYADERNWNGVEKIRRVMRERGLKKNLGSSRIQNLACFALSFDQEM